MLSQQQQELLDKMARFEQDLDDENINLNDLLNNIEPPLNEVNLDELLEATEDLERISETWRNNANLAEEEEDLDENTDLISKSYLNPSIVITSDQWAISYLKKANISSKPNGMSEHIMIIMQSHTTLYRADLAQNEQDESMAVIIYKQESFDNNATLRKAFKKISAKFVLDENAKKFHKTWTISSLKGEQFLETVQYDLACPIFYQALGGHSILTKESLPKVDKYLMLYYLASNSSLRYNTSIYLLNRCLNRHKYPPNGCRYAYNKYQYPEQYNSIGSRYSDDELLKINKHKNFRIHNCASWAVSILRSLDIEEINRDIGIGITDYLISLPSMHLGDNEDVYENVKFTKDQVFTKENKEAIKGSSQTSNEYIFATTQKFVEKSKQKSNCLVC